MSIYAVLILIAAVGVFAYATDMVEPFSYLCGQFNSILAHIKTNNVLFNAVVLALVIGFFAGVIRKLFEKSENKEEAQINNRQEEEPEDRPGNVRF